MTIEIDNYLPEYRKVSDAPTLQQLKLEAAREGISLTQRLLEESRVWYKAYSHFAGSKGFWLVQNPALMTAQSVTGATALRRRQPRRVDDAAQRSVARPKWFSEEA